MPRMIDADALTNKYGDWYTEEGTEVGFIGSLKTLIDLQPTVDAVPVSFIQELIKQDNQFIEAYGGIQECEVIVDGLIERVTNYEALIEKWREKNGTEID